MDYCELKILIFIIFLIKYIYSEREKWTENINFQLFDSACDPINSAVSIICAPGIPGLLRNVRWFGNTMDISWFLVLCVSHCTYENCILQSTHFIHFCYIFVICIHTEIPNLIHIHFVYHVFSTNIFILCKSIVTNIFCNL